MEVGIDVETVYRLRVKDVELTLTRPELLKLRDTIDKIISPKDLTDDNWEALQENLDVPSGVPKDISPFAMAMLAVCIKYHKGYKNRVHASEIVDEIVEDYPEVAEFYESKGRMSYATIFTADNGRGAGLVPAGLLKMKKENGSRLYWVE